ncbi:MAG: hypothetical protein CMH83_19760 [Nocardioides sp.]|nr:hypothetical protein [Nocardioides sp.]
MSRRRLAPTLARTLAPALLAVPLLAACSSADETAAVDPEPAVAASPEATTDAPPEQNTEPAPTEDAPTEASTPEPTEDPVPPGEVVAWDDYDADPAAYDASTVVLYFHAPWCHECQATDAAIESDGMPDGLTLVQIDYDSRTDLRQRYGVTVQHSFVTLDGSGDRDEVWTETIGPDDILARAEA